jgi:hypothetical protein
MCRKLLCLAALLVFASAAAAQTTTLVVDDFEMYFDSSELQAVWYDSSAAGVGNTADRILLTSGAPQGYQAMSVDYYTAGGWKEPGNPTNYDKVMYSGTTVTFAPYDFTEQTLIKFELKVDEVYNELNYLLIEYTGDMWTQTWNAGPAAAAGMIWWFPPENVPTLVGPDGYTGPGSGNYDYTGHPIVHPSDGWVTVTIDYTDDVDWGNNLVDFAAMTGMSFQWWTSVTDTTGNSGWYKIHPTDGTVWPSGPLNGYINIDNVRFIEIPEPMTIGLLGLGGLALIRRKR